MSHTHHITTQFSMLCAQIYLKSSVGTVVHSEVYSTCMHRLKVLM